MANIDPVDDPNARHFVVFKNDGAEVDFCISAEDYDRVRQHNWSITGNGYIVSRAGGNTVVYLHRFIMSPLPNQLIDHINGDKLDNRRCNLRTATHRQNSQNAKRRVDNKSGYKGVFKVNNRWSAYIRSGGVKRHIGYYDTPEGAALAYNNAAILLHRQFAKLNIIPPAN